jgi:hypothetical protein
MFGLVFVKYINEPIIYLYKVTCTIFDEVSHNNFGFVVIGVVMDLQSIIPNLFRISTTYSLTKTNLTLILPHFQI